MAYRNFHERNGTKEQKLAEIRTQAQAKAKEIARKNWFPPSQESLEIAKGLQKLGILYRSGAVELCHIEVCRRHPASFWKQKSYERAGYIKESDYWTDFHIEPPSEKLTNDYLEVVAVEPGFVASYTTTENVRPGGMAEESYNVTRFHSKFITLNDRFYVQPDVSWRGDICNVVDQNVGGYGKASAGGEEFVLSALRKKLTEGAGA